MLIYWNTLRGGDDIVGSKEGPTLFCYSSYYYLGYFFQLYAEKMYDITTSITMQIEDNFKWLLKESQPNIYLDRWTHVFE